MSRNNFPAAPGVIPGAGSGLVTRADETPHAAAVRGGGINLPEWMDEDGWMVEPGEIPEGNETNRQR